VPGVRPPDPTRLGEVVWLEPFPDDLAPADTAPGPEARYDAAESISLAFVAALQLLPPRQLAVLVLRDVLAFRAAEVAEMLDTTQESVTSALKRARATLRRQYGVPVEPPPEAGSPAEQAIVAAFARAYESSDVAAIVALLTDDVFMAMPPMPLEYEGPQLVGEFLSLLFGAGRKYHLVPTRANGQPAFASYVDGPDGAPHSTGLFVVALAGNRISAMTRFENTVLPWFGMPRSLEVPRATTSELRRSRRLLRSC
jgi:RNA polymerase sigma-70 factor (ECF subfamily)